MRKSRGDVKIVTVLGARPQFIKASVVSTGMAKHGSVNEVVVHTGQHFDANMSEVFFAELDMPEPKYHLGINGGNHGEMTGRMLVEVEKVLLAERPDVVLVYGDTNSTLAGALAAAKLYIPVAHVEAGLRSFNMHMPEEVNRILTDQVSKWLFAPTDQAVAHLQREGINPSRIHQVGDVMYDVALHYGERTSRMKTNAAARLGLPDKGYVLATIHRAENADDWERLRVIVDALIETSRHLPVVWPLHPRTRGVLDKAGMLPVLERAVHLTEPLGYMKMVQLERSAAVIATDSGGVQKEAFFYRVPCVTLRNETEWVELVSAGWNTLAPPVNPEVIQRAIEAAVGRRGADIAPYGQGDAARRIVRRLADDLST